MATQASNLYSNNITKLLLSMGQQNHFIVDLNDEVVRGSIALNKGELLWPPPKPAQPAPSQAATTAKKPEKKEEAIDPWKSTVQSVCNSKYQYQYQYLHLYLHLYLYLLSISPSIYLSIYIVISHN